MTVSTSRLAFEDCYTVMMAALEDPKGVRMKAGSQDAAIHFRLRCHQARKIDRAENAQTYERPHPMHGVSPYDKLVLKIRQDTEGWWLLFEQNGVIPGEVQSLTTGEQLALDMPQLMPPPKQIEPPRTPSDEELGDAFEDIPTVGEILPPMAKPAIRRI